MQNLRFVLEHTRFCRPIIDGSIVSEGLTLPNHESLTSFLLPAEPYKITRVDDVQRSKAIANFDEASNFIYENPPYVIEEVRRELQAFSNSLWRIYGTYEQKLRENQGVWSGLNGVHSRGVENIREIAVRASSLNTQAVFNIHSVDWDSYYPAHFLDLARRNSRDLVKESMARHGGSCIGIELETDQRLAALAYVAARKEKVALITADGGIVKIIHRIQSLSNQNFCLNGHAYHMHELLACNVRDGMIHRFRGNI